MITLGQDYDYKCLNIGFTTDLIPACNSPTLRRMILIKSIDMRS